MGGSDDLVSLLSLLDKLLGDPDADQVRRSHANAIRQLQTLAAAAWIVVGDFLVPNGGSVLVRHGLGRAPAQVVLSPPRVEFGTPGLVAGGILIDLTGPDVNRRQAIRIFGTGYGVAVTVTVSVL